MLHLASDIIKGQTANSSHVTGSILHTTYCTLHTVPALVPVPVHFILHNEQWLLHTVFLFFMFHIYHCLSWNSKWWWQKLHWYKLVMKRGQSKNCGQVWSVHWSLHRSAKFYNNFIISSWLTPLLSFSG